MVDGSVELTLTEKVGAGALGEYILELMARNLVVTIYPTERIVKQLEATVVEGRDEREEL